jgi:hypothetical protein
VRGRNRVPPCAILTYWLDGFKDIYYMEYIDCTICEQNMNSFIENSLVGENVWQFLTHVERCPECYEELETRYLIAEALGRLEAGESIDLRKELQQKIKFTKRAMYFHYFNEDVLRILEVFSMIIIVYEVFGFLSHFFGIVF